jgi:hypothetical protein
MNVTNGINQQYLYPESLLPHIKSGWPKATWHKAEHKSPPPDSHILQMLNIAFQASLSSQERRSIRLRIAYCDPDDLLKDVEVRKRNRPIKFNKPRTLSVSEIVQLAPAIDPRQLLIGIRPVPKSNQASDPQLLEIWGLIDSGHSWWEFVRGERKGGLGGSPPPDCLTVSAMSPGNLIASRGGEMIISLEKGKLILPMPDVFYFGPISEYLNDVGRAFHTDVCKDLGVEKYDPDDEDEDYPQRFLKEFIGRVLIRIRDRRHGGTLLMVPDEWSISDTRLREGVDIKYPTIDTDIWSLLVEYVSLHKNFYDNLFNAWSKKPVPAESFNYIQVLDMQYSDAEDLVRDRANLLASLANVDGSVVLTTKLRLLGFGAEVIASSPALHEIRIASDPSGLSGDMRPLTDYGTRHRSALRFCSSHEGLLAFVVSQDGDIRVIKRVGSEVVLWSGTVKESAT